MLDPDQDIRSEAFAYVARVTRGGEGVITWRELSAFSYHGRRVPLVSQQGIFKPAAMQFPISIRTTYRAPGEPRPYEDAEDEDEQS